MNATGMTRRTAVAVDEAALRDGEIPSTTTSGAGQPRRAGLRSHLSAALLVIVAVTVALLIGPAPAASAATWSNASGSLGSVTLNGAMITGRDAWTYIYVGGVPVRSNTRVFDSNGITVWGSPSSTGQQRILVRYYLQRHDGTAWGTINSSNLMTGYAFSTTAVDFGGWAVANPKQFTTQSGYRVVFGIDWIHNATGRLLATALVVPSLQSDNRCATVSIPCTAFTDGIRM